MTHIRREFTSHAPRRMGTLRRRWAEPDDPRAITSPATPTQEPEGQETDLDPAPEVNETGPVVAYKPDADPSTRPPLPGRPDPRQVAARSKAVVVTVEASTPTINDALLGSLMRRSDERVQRHRA